jgi:hypothetical protein
VLNRAVLILRYKQPFVDWINAADPDSTHAITLSDSNQDSTAYLIEVEDEEQLEEWLELNGELLFEQELEGWYADESLWPPDRSLALFREWCTFELCTMVVDTGESPLHDDAEDEFDQ